jgi:hypothetical protein
VSDNVSPGGQLGGGIFNQADRQGAEAAKLPELWQGGLGARYGAP